MRKLFIPFLLFICVAANAQKKSSPTTYAKSITAEDMKRHLYIIASAEMEGRNTPSPGLEKAADYIENHFKSLGLLPGNNGSYRLQYPLFKDSMTSTSLTVNDKAFELSKDFQPTASIDHTAELRFSEVVFAGYGIVDGASLDAYKGLNVKGKVVMIVDGMPANYKPTGNGFNSPAGMFGKLNKARDNGAAAVLIVAGNFPRKSFASAGNYAMNNYPAAIFPETFTISEAVAQSILGADGDGLVDKMKTAPLESKVYKANIALSYAKTSITGHASNVIGIIEGTDKKDEYVFLTSHYDHLGKTADGVINYGADDDGSGTTGVLEMAEAWSKAKAAGKGPRRTLVFMTVSGEEKGLWGSAYYNEHPIFPQEKTSVDLNTDMIGRIGVEYLKDKDSTNYVYVIGDDKLSTDLTPITEMINNKYLKMKLDRKYNDLNDKNRFYYRSDHFNFAQKGIPVIFYFNGVHADYHRPTDTPDKINYPLMAKRAQLVFYTSWEMANRDEMLKRDIALPKTP